MSGAGNPYLGAMKALQEKTEQLNNALVKVKELDKSAKEMSDKTGEDLLNAMRNQKPKDLVKDLNKDINAYNKALDSLTGPKSSLEKLKDHLINDKSVKGEDEALSAILAERRNLNILLERIRKYTVVLLEKNQNLEAIPLLTRLKDQQNDIEQKLESLNAKYMALKELKDAKSVYVRQVLEVDEAKLDHDANLGLVAKKKLASDDKTVKESLGKLNARKGILKVAETSLNTKKENVNAVFSGKPAVVAQTVSAAQQQQMNVPPSQQQKQQQQQQQVAPPQQQQQQPAAQQQQRPTWADKKKNPPPTSTVTDTTTATTGGSNFSSDVAGRMQQMQENYEQTKAKADALTKVQLEIRGLKGITATYEKSTGGTFSAFRRGRFNDRRLVQLDILNAAASSDLTSNQRNMLICVVYRSLLEEATATKGSRFFMSELQKKLVAAYPELAETFTNDKATINGLENSLKNGANADTFNADVAKVNTVLHGLEVKYTTSQQASTTKLNVLQSIKPHAQDIHNQVVSKKPAKLVLK